MKGLAIADDSGLCVESLGGAPGVKSARFAGRSKNDKSNNLKVLELLNKSRSISRRAKFVCAVALADNGKIVKVIEENCRGVIAPEARGHRGFGYDSIFMIPGLGRTFGQLGLKTKDKMSHRSKALKKARAFLRKYL